MTREQQQKLIKECFEDRMEIMRKKGKDYSNGQDVLSNFKGSGANIGLTAEMQILSLISTKVARLGVLLNSNKPPENESIADSIKDLANYTDLLYCAVNEGKAKSKHKTVQKSILQHMMQADERDGLYDIPDNSVIGNAKSELINPDNVLENWIKYNSENDKTAYHRDYTENKGRC